MLYAFICCSLGSDVMGSNKDLIHSFITGGKIDLVALLWGLGGVDLVERRHWCRFHLAAFSAFAFSWNTNSKSIPKAFLISALLFFKKSTCEIQDFKSLPKENYCLDREVLFKVVRACLFSVMQLALLIEVSCCRYSSNSSRQRFNRAACCGMARIKIYIYKWHLFSLRWDLDSGLR